MKKQIIKEKRKDLLRKAPRKTLIRKRDKRVTSPSRVCGICGESLTGMIYTTGKVIVKKSHYHIKYSDFLYIDLCQDINTCYKNMED